MSLALSAQTFTTLYTFGSQALDGVWPQSGLILGPQGELYGTTSGGGRWDSGTAYELMPPASPGGSWTEAVLHSFNAQDGFNPNFGVTLGPNGSLYGVARTSDISGGAAFQLNPPSGASAGWTYKIIYQTDGYLESSLVFGSPLGYGQSLYGADLGGNGSVYRLTPPATAGGKWTQTTLYTFPGGSGGSLPGRSLAVGAGSTLFGVTIQGGYVGGCGYYGCGTVFSLTPPAQAGAPWTERILHGFEAWIGDGATPIAGVVIGAGGVLYGTTSAGPYDHGSGTVFSLTPPTVPGAPMAETILHVFAQSGGDGTSPNALVRGPNGVLYGTTQSGGASNYGTVFELAPPASPGGSWTETILYSFTDGADGLEPDGLTIGPDGTLYGTTEIGGTGARGTVFALTP